MDKLLYVPQISAAINELHNHGAPTKRVFSSLFANTRMVPYTLFMIMLFTNVNLALLLYLIEDLDDVTTLSRDITMDDSTTLKVLLEEKDKFVARSFNGVSFSEISVRLETSNVTQRKMILDYYNRFRIMMVSTYADLRPMLIVLATLVIISLSGKLEFLFDLNKLNIMAIAGLIEYLLSEKGNMMKSTCRVSMSDMVLQDLITEKLAQMNLTSSSRVSMVKNYVKLHWELENAPSTKSGLVAAVSDSYVLRNALPTVYSVKPYIRLDRTTYFNRISKSKICLEVIDSITQMANDPHFFSKWGEAVKRYSWFPQFDDIKLTNIAELIKLIDMIDQGLKIELYATNPPLQDELPAATNMGNSSDEELSMDTLVDQLMQQASNSKGFYTQTIANQVRRESNILADSLSQEEAITPKIKANESDIKRVSFAESGDDDSDNCFSNTYDYTSDDTGSDLDGIMGAGSFTVQYDEK